MALNITGYEHAEITPEHDRTEDCLDDEHVMAFVYEGHEATLAGLVPDRCYAVAGRVQGWNRDYESYNVFREALSRAALGVEPETVWKDPATYRDRPYYELIYFADNEGTVGPVAAAALAADFADRSVREALPERWRADYDALGAIFALAARDGLVNYA